MPFGAHMSIAGGLDLAVERAARAGCEVLQVFTKSSNQWKAKPLSDGDVGLFRARIAEKGIGAVSAHDSYLINLAAPGEALWRRSIESFIVEIERCDRLAIPFLIAHPGAHTGSGTEAGIRRIAAALDEAAAHLPAARVRVLLEITAGQGSTVGSRFEEIAAILDAVRDPDRLGVCFDTCHAFAAGYDFRSEAGYAKVFRSFDRAVGLGRLEAFHLNDCKQDLGSRLDRHEHIGKGWIGLEGFRLLVNDPRFLNLPMYLETPKGPELLEDVENLKTLRSLRGETRPIPWEAPAQAVRRPRQKTPPVEAPARRGRAGAERGR